MSRFVQRDQSALVVRDDDAGANAAKQDAIARLLDVAGGDERAFRLYGDDRRLVEQVGEVRTRMADGELRQAIEIDVVGERGPRRVDLQDLETIANRRELHLDDAIETARTTHRGIEHVFAIGRRHPDDTVAPLHSIHFDEQLVQRDFLFAGAIGTSTAATERIELIDEDDAGRLFASLLCELANASGPHADVDLIEIGAGRHDHRTARFAGDRACEECLAGTWSADEQHALGALGTHGPKALRVTK